MKNNRVNIFLVTAIVMTVLLLAPTVYGGLLIFGDRTASLEPVTHNLKQLDEMPADDALLSPVNSELPLILAPEIFYISTQTGIPRSDMGFAIFTEQKYRNTTLPKLLAVGISSGTHKGGMIFRTSDNITVISPLGYFVSNPGSWKIRDFSNLMGYLSGWHEEGEITGNADDFEFIDFSTRKQVSWQFKSSVYQLTKDELIFTPNINPYSAITDNSLIPTLPPILFLAIFALLAVVAAVLLWKVGHFDMSLATFAVIPTILLAGGVSIFLVPHLHISVIPIASFLVSGLLWSIPVILLWFGLELEKTAGLFWLTYSVIFAITILNNLFPYVWLSAIGVLTIAVIILAILVPAGARDLRLK